MKSSKAIRFGMAAVVLVLLLAACMHPSDSDSSASGSPTSGTSSSPQIEPTSGLESPVSPTNGGPSLSLPSPPVGNNNHNNGGQCIQITWLTKPIPQGDVVTITSVTVPGPRYSLDLGVTAGCQGGRSCIGYQFNESNDNNTFCNVGLAYKGGTIDINDDTNSDTGTIVIAGRLSCPHSSSARCRNDGSVMEAAAKPISFNTNVTFSTPTPSTSSPPTSSSSESTPSSPSGSSSSSPTTSDSSPPVAPGSP